ncbi:MAG: hypothetical protein AAB225_01465 [Acidobacteriota bacterium]
MAVWLCLPLAAQPQGQRAPLPYRFLLVISDQWKDPASCLVEGGGEFQIIVSLLKTWGLPFDILRLDQQRLDKYHLLERDGAPRYGTIIWDPAPAGMDGQDDSLAALLVKEHGVGLVVLGDALVTPAVAEVAGLRYVSQYRLPGDVVVVRDHFITRELGNRGKEFLGTSESLPGSKVEVREGTVLATRYGLPFVAIREFDGGGRVAWLNLHRASAQAGKQVARDLFKRALVWAQGYALYKEYPRSLILFMDDMGTSDKTYLPYWHYRTPTESEIREGLIDPLKRHHAVLVQNVNTGFVDRGTQRVLNPWLQERVLDSLDGKTIHDYRSTKRGLDAGLREGVFEIQSHGWTHMLPDLDSRPGPWWTAPMDGAGSLDWYNEFGDRLRQREIPAATQRFHLARSIEEIQRDFGVTPLYLNAGGGAYSQSAAHHSMVIAAQIGFGLSKLGSPGYLGRDLVVAMGPVVPNGGWAFNRRLTAADVPWTVDGPYFLTFHDRDLAMDAGSIARLLDDLGQGVRYMSANEYCAYLHARVEGDLGAGRSLSLTVHYDDHYCRHFALHSSSWTLHLSDETRKLLEKPLPEKQTIEIPKGLGRHGVMLHSSSR